jgi:histidinol dehydrogenase
MKLILKLRTTKGFTEKKFAEIALQNSKSILLNSIDEAIEFSNYYAPEHLILAIENAENFTDKIKNAGSVFLGNYSPKVQVIMLPEPTTPCQPTVLLKITAVFLWTVL